MTTTILFSRLHRYILTLLLFSITDITIAAKTASADSACTHNCPNVAYVQNQFWTTGYGPAAANILISSDNFLVCKGNPYALCYYSGPNETAPGSNGNGVNYSCTLASDGSPYANCNCYSYNKGINYVDINSIINTEAYIETVRACGTDGSQCENLSNHAACLAGISICQKDLPTAPVCDYLGNTKTNTLQTLVPGFQPGYTRLSTFSFEESQNYDFGSTDCRGTYAGCMTAPCIDKVDNEGNSYAECKCPLYKGPYQVGQNLESQKKCFAGKSLVWSAAYTPSTKTHKQTLTLFEKLRKK